MEFTFNSFCVMSYYFFIKQNNKFFMSYNFLQFFTTFLLTPFDFLFSLPSTLTKEYIFDFNPTNSLIISPLNSSVILPITFLLTASKKFESCG